MQLERNIFLLRRLCKTACLALLIPALLAALFLAANPHLHDMLHHDASHPSHQCAVAMFEQQQLSASNPNVIVVELNPALAISLCFSETTAFSDFNYRFSASRAPPLSPFPAIG